MSADNHIAILNSQDGYRVVHCQALDNLVFWHKEGEGINQFEARDTINPFVLYKYFKDAKFFATKSEALAYAIKLERRIGYVEYGIGYVFYEGFFPTEEPPCCEAPNLVINDAGDNVCENCGEYHEND
jgi:hypothetical protein